MKPKILIPLLALACLLAVPATAQVNYAVSGDTAYVASSPLASGNIVIASTYHDRPVTSIGAGAFSVCTRLTSVTFLGNAPTGGAGIFSDVDAGATVYYYNGATGWGPTYGGLPTVMLVVPAPQVGTGSAGVKPGGFGFTLNGILNQTIVVEAGTYLVNWPSIWTNTLSAGSTNFVDPQWVNYPRRFYRLRSP